MLTELIIKGNSLRGIFSDIETLIPSGTKTVPVGISCRKNKLQFTVKGICDYESYIDVTTDVDVELTVVYSATSDLIDPSTDAIFEIHPGGVCVKTAVMSRFFNVGYSVVSPSNMADDGFMPMSHTGAMLNFSTLLKTPLSAIYKNSPPIDIFNEVAMLKYGNLWLQVRVPGFPVNCTVTQECLQIATKFNPTHYKLIGQNSLLLKRDKAILGLTVKSRDELSTVATLVPKDVSVIRTNLGKFGLIPKKLKATGCIRLMITLLSSGVSLSGDTENGNLSVTHGSGDFIASFHLPLDVASFIFGLFVDCSLEIIYGGGILCMRTQDVALAIHVLL